RRLDRQGGDDGEREPVAHDRLDPGGPCPVVSQLQPEGLPAREVACHGRSRAASAAGSTGTTSGPPTYDSGRPSAMARSTSGPRWSVSSAWVTSRAAGSSGANAWTASRATGPATVAGRTRCVSVTPAA